MDFLDPKFQRRHGIQLVIGYIGVAIAIMFATWVLLYQAYGFGLNNKGQVVQNGLLFVSSHPAGAEIYLSNVLNTALTNSRLSVPSGNYTLKVSRSGYRDWQRPIDVIGGSVERFDYPFLFPINLVTTTVGSYSAAPALTTQSPDQRWLLVQQPVATPTFDEYDLKNPKNPPTVLTLPTSVYTVGTTQSWQVVEWSNDNTHLLLQHSYDGKTEFIVMDRTDTTKSVNLNTTLQQTPTRVNLLNQAYDHYYLYNAAAQTLQTASLSSPTPQPFLDHVLDYKPYGSNVMLYVSSISSVAGKATIDLYQDGQTNELREVTAGGSYMLNLTQYNGSWYVAVGASSEGKVYIYKNPVTLLNSPLGAIRPIYVLQNPKPNYVAFSASAQFIMDESGSQFAIFDAKNDVGYRYDTTLPLDAPQQHATWMDADRLMYISGGKLVVFDYDHQNVQTLMPANPGYVPVFNPSYSFVDALGLPQTGGKVDLTSTALLTPADQ